MFGEPDAIVPAGEKSLNQMWKCANCGHVYANVQASPIPAPCEICGGLPVEAEEST